MVSVEVAGGRLLVRAPYNPDFPDRAKPLGGKWAPAEKAWAFDPRDEVAVRGICRATYGTDGSVLVPADLCTVRVTLTETLTGTAAAVFLGGREIACASGRDSGATVGPGVVFIEGRPGSGGSVKNWTTEVRKGSVFEIRDLPRAAVPLVEKGLRAKYGTGTHGTVEVIENAAPAVDADALRLERERLASRIAEIDRLLGEAGAA